YVTSAGAGPSLGKHVVMVYLPPEHANEGEQLAVQYMESLLPATVEIVGSRPTFDPDNERISACGSSAVCSAWRSTAAAWCWPRTRRGPRPPPWAQGSACTWR